MNNLHNLLNILNSQYILIHNLEQTIMDLNEKQCDKCVHKIDCRSQSLSFANFNKNDKCNSYEFIKE